MTNTRRPDYASKALEALEDHTLAGYERAKTLALLDIAAALRQLAVAIRR
jgi:hypothetical protein